MSSELSKVQVEYISEDKIIKVKRGGFGVRVLLCNRLDANGPRSRVSVGAGGGRGERAPAVWGPSGHTQEVVTASRATPLPK